MLLYRLMFLERLITHQQVPARVRSDADRRGQRRMAGSNRSVVGTRHSGGGGPAEAR